jgi:hypothetical protein
VSFALLELFIVSEDSQQIPFDELLEPGDGDNDDLTSWQQVFFGAAQHDVQRLSACVCRKIGHDIVKAYVFRFAEGVAQINAVISYAIHFRVSGNHPMIESHDA